MIKKLKIGLLVAVLSLFVGVGSASAVNITYSDYTDVLVTLSGSDVTLTIAPGSGATSVVTAATTLGVVIPTSSTFTILSHNNLTLLLNSGTATTSNTCTGTTNTLVITSTSTADYTITPNSGVCSAGGGGGGGGGTPSDTTPPTATSVSINAGVATTSTITATLTLAATDATQMLISNDAGFAGASWETYATSKSWMLTSGDGVKTVYAKFRDVALNMSMAVSDTIIVSGTGTIAVVSNEPTQGCSGGNMYNTSTGALCVNNAGPQIPGCGSGTSGFSMATGQSCAGNRSVSGSYSLGVTTLKNGSKGNAVKELQRFLNDKLSLGLVMDGVLGPKTIIVIKQWQKDNGLVADGLIGAKTKAMMNAETIPATPASPSTTTGSYNLGATTLKNGSRGEAVKELQRFLNDKLDLGLVMDGVLGPKTIAVIKQWQADNGLVADGLIGAKTKAMMNAEADYDY